MLSRFSSLFTYVVVGLVVSVAATPMGPLDGLTGGGTKASSHPGSSYAMKPYDKPMPYGQAKPYGYDNDKSYDNGKPYDNGRPYDNNKPKPYGGDHKSESYGQCSTGTQHCCNQVNKVNISYSFYVT